MPHLLIAGSTGSGKSMFINSLIISTLYRSSPETIQLILVDTKSDELKVYNGIPHLPVKVITKPKAASEMLKWAVLEMERRNRLFIDNEVRNIDEYSRLHLEGNCKSEENLPQTHFKLPHVIIIVDELAELMWSEEDIEDPICHLAMLAQDAGIHLIIATQLPTCDILTGRIKANIPSRIAFKVSCIEDSITIIDQEGAESLLGMGDMLYYPQGHSKPLRLQGAFVSDDEVNKVVGHLKKVNYSNFFKNPFSDDENIIILRTKIEEIESDIWK